jgi:hypothetical protein
MPKLGRQILNNLYPTFTTIGHARGPAIAAENKGGNRRPQIHAAARQQAATVAVTACCRRHRGNRDRADGANKALFCQCFSAVR